MQPRPSPARIHCQACRESTLQTFAGWAGDGSENSVRPRAFYRSCARCGATHLTLADVTDAEWLAKLTVIEWLRGKTAARADGWSDGSIDPGEAVAQANADLWQLYLEWRPDLGNASFLSYARHHLPLRVATWSRGASGEAETRAKGRRYPKAHAASVSVSLDAYTAPDGGGDANGTSAGNPAGLDVHFGASTADHAEDRSVDLFRVLAGGDGTRARAERETGVDSARGAPAPARRR